MKTEKTTHTPGPWHVAGYGILGPEAKLKDSIAVTSVRTRNGLGLSKFDDEERKANARLIAAAPDYDAMARRLAAWDANPNGGGRELEAICDMARAAIAKAEGK